MRLKFGKQGLALLAPTILVLLTLVIAFLNYQPNTWLSGWDNLHPEIDIGIDLPRSFAAFWQEYRGLGLAGGMAHAADLPRQLLILFSQNFVAAPLVRYLWTFFMLGLGSVGAYFLATQTLLRKFDRYTRYLAGFFAGLFYLLNLGTVQNFYAPFETFTSFFGFLPWLLLSHIFYLRSPSRRSALVLVLVQLLAAPAFYVHTLFLVYLLCLLPFYLGYLLDRKHWQHKLVHILVSGLMILFASAYWLFPPAYYALTHSQITINAAQNQIASREVIARNQEYGSLDKVLLLKGFWFDYVDLGDNNQFGLMMSPWVKHFSQRAVSLVGYLFFALAVIAIGFAFKRKLTFRFQFLGLFLLGLFFLINLNPPIEPIYRFFQESIPLAKEIFRSSFTKWIIPLSLAFAVWFSVGVVFLLDIFSGLNYRLTPVVTSFSLLLAFLLYAAPAFQGHFIYDKMRLNFPEEYQELFSYLKTQDPAKRLANFPQQTFWGWQFYDWGYRGSGFLWYGIQQPILDRAFDVWSPYSQAYYEQIRHAIYSQNQKEFLSLLDKYAIGYLLLDEHIISPGTNEQTTLYQDQLEAMIQSAPGITKADDWGKLKLYQYQPAGQPDNFINTKAFPLEPQTSVGDTSLAPVILDTPLDNHSQIKEATNCDNFNATQFSRTVTAQQVEYTATNASSCDHLVFSEPSQGRAYRLNITHRNFSGEPFFVCLESHASKQCEIFQYLPASSNWTTTSLPVPALKTGDSGYTLHLYNYSIGNVKTINAWSQISLAPATTLALPYSLPQLPYAQVKTVSHPNPVLYRLDLESSDASYLVLDQAFDEGWKAFRLDNLRIKSPLFTVLTQVPLPESNHFEFYGWANGWAIPPQTTQVILFYLPQLWQYFGFGLLFLLPILILSHHPKKASEEGR